MDDRMDCEASLHPSNVKALYPNHQWTTQNPLTIKTRTIFQASERVIRCVGVEPCYLDMDPCDPIPIDETVLRDIKQFLVEEFIRISHKFRSSSDLQPWPSEGQLTELVRRASDVWICAQTVIRFVEEPQFDPRTRLQLVLGRGSKITDALESLDALYSAILSVFPPMPTLPAFVDILRAAVGGINPEDIDDLMQLPLGAARYRSKEFWIYTKDADARMLDRTTHFLSVQDPLLRHPVSDYLSERIRRLSVVRFWVLVFFFSVNPEFLHRMSESSFQLSLSSLQAQYREPFVELLTRQKMPSGRKIDNDFRFVWNFEVALWLEPAAGPPLPLQPQLDATYLHLLSTHPPVLRFIRTVLAWQHILNRRHTVPVAIQVSGLSWFDLRPRSWNTGAGGVYLYDSIYACDLGSREPTTLKNGLNWAILITGCKPCLTVLHELKTLDPIHFCKYADDHPEIHFRDHERSHSPSKQHFDTVIGWLQEFEPRPKDVIDFWANRRRLAGECHSRTKSYIQSSDMAKLDEWEFVPERLSSGGIREEGEEWLTAEGKPWW
ncbi:hypothetical protein C8F04DRAFT_1188193 [Mycena alexandri]|uniref:Uncharacterized protein n=1 Tax=Mycena alexandri TaxID=1745969 RepID=A0AAD6SK47_9AGAR|nr:hypothetical protein C8F04DRAFT_1188193 [Mycena alexandri]